MTVSSIVSTLFMFSVLIPSKLWFAPDQPIAINVDTTEPVSVVLVDFLGKTVPTQIDTAVPTGKQIDLRQFFPGLKDGTYILYVVPKDKMLPDFVGTPLVVQFRMDKRANADSGALAVRVEPLRFAEMETSAGSMTMAFYYDVAPNTVNNFLALAEQGYFDGQVFHRIIKGFVVQGGDPLGRDVKRGGTGGPGYMIDAEFNDRQHQKGVLSMARQGDPLEQQGMMPRGEFANSASSQFFICLDYAKTKALDGKYTAFGKLTSGLDTLDKLGNAQTGPRDRPVENQEIKKVTVKVVTPGNNPYEKLFAAE